MTIRYQNTFRDIIALCFYHYPRSPLVMGVYSVGFAIISLIIFQELPKGGDVVTTAIAFAYVEAIAFSFFTGMCALSIVLSMVSRRNKTLLTQHTIALGAESFTSETPYSKTEQKWTIVQNLARTKNYIFIYVAQLPAMPSAGDPIPSKPPATAVLRRRGNRTKTSRLELGSGAEFLPWVPRRPLCAPAVLSCSARCFLHAARGRQSKTRQSQMHIARIATIRNLNVIDRRSAG